MIVARAKMYNHCAFSFFLVGDTKNTTPAAAHIHPSHVGYFADPICTVEPHNRGYLFTRNATDSNATSTQMFVFVR